ncbi:MAG TPA: alpha/beta hydrolase-fold protein [Terriglobales bacterium]|nr:alpha/beta hydrolase-fold protein [Terriglobales bacterium]
MDETPPLNPAIQDANHETPSSVVGDLRLHEFSSRIFRNKRLLRVWLPPGYELPENSGKRYPVFYLNDGQNLFDGATSFTGVEWQVDETADRLIRAGAIPPTIFVGIDNAGVERLKEYVPYRSLNPLLLRPLGDRYPSFLIREVMPFIGQNYRAAKGPENSFLGGSSLGGLITLYTILAAPSVFGGALLESASLWVANRQVLKDSRTFRQWPHKIFLAVGTREAGREDKDQQTVENARELERILRRSGLDDRRLRVEIAEGGTHSEGAWAARFPEVLQFLLGQ